MQSALQVVFVNCRYHRSHMFVNCRYHRSHMFVNCRYHRSHMFVNCRYHRSHMFVNCGYHRSHMFVNCGYHRSHMTSHRNLHNLLKIACRTERWYATWNGEILKIFLRSSPPPLPRPPILRSVRNVGYRPWLFALTAFRTCTPISQLRTQTHAYTHSTPTPLIYALHGAQCWG
jgi:hypothetical protein